MLRRNMIYSYDHSIFFIKSTVLLNLLINSEVFFSSWDKSFSISLRDLSMGIVVIIRVVHKRIYILIN